MSEKSFSQINSEQVDIAQLCLEKALKHYEKAGSDWGLGLTYMHIATIHANYARPEWGSNRDGATSMHASTYFHNTLLRA